MALTTALSFTSVITAVAQHVSTSMGAVPGTSSYIYKEAGREVQWSLNPGGSKSGIYTLTYKAVNNDHLRFTITNDMGRMFYEENLLAEPGIYNVSLDLGYLPTGYYIARLFDVRTGQGYPFTFRIWHDDSMGPK